MMVPTKVPSKVPTPAPTPVSIQWFNVGSASMLWLLSLPGYALGMPAIAEPTDPVPHHEAAALGMPDGATATSLTVDLAQIPETPSSSETEAGASSSSQWHFSFEPFVVLPVSTTGTLRVRDISVDVNAGLSEVLAPLNLAFLGQFEGWYENQGFVVNATYFSAGESATANFDLPPLPFPLALEASASADLLRTDLLYAYRFTEKPESGYGEGFTEFDLPPVSFDLMGGLRFYWLSQEVSVNSNVGFSASRSNSDFILQPVVRGRLRWNTSDYLAVLLDTSVSGLSLTGDSTFAVTATAGIEWLFSGNTSLSAGYQVNYIDYATNGGETGLDLLAHGPRLSFTFRF